MPPLSPSHVPSSLPGPVFQFSYIWQLVINTGTTIVAFLMVFLIENTLNRDSAALHFKLDELIRINEVARNRRQMFCQVMTMTTG